MRENMRGRDGMTGADVLTQTNAGQNLGLRKYGGGRFFCAVQMSDMNQFNANGRRIYIRLAGPMAFSGVPRPRIFANQLCDPSIFPDQIMAGHFRLRITKAGEGQIARLQLRRERHLRRMHARLGAGGAGSGIGPAMARAAQRRVAPRRSTALLRGATASRRRGACGT